MILAEERGYDILEIAPQEIPPTCKLVDFGKWKFEQKKKSHGQKKQVHRRKEVKLRPKTEEHDLKVKLNHSRRFLEKGHKVQLTMVFRGREALHFQAGQELLLRFGKELADIAKIETPPTREARNRMFMVLTGK